MKSDRRYAPDCKPADFYKKLRNRVPADLPELTRLFGSRQAELRPVTPQGIAAAPLVRENAMRPA
jgi:hypothetical protein